MARGQSTHTTRRMLPCRSVHASYVYVPCYWRRSTYVHTPYQGRCGHALPCGLTREVEGAHWEGMSLFLSRSPVQKRLHWRRVGKGKPSPRQDARGYCSEVIPAQTVQRLPGLATLLSAEDKLLERDSEQESESTSASDRRRLATILGTLDADLGVVVF